MMMRVLFLLGVLLVSVASLSHAMEKGVFQPPSLDGYTFDKETLFDADKDGVKESTVVIYKNAVGDRVYSMTTRTKLWLWGVDKTGDDNTDTTKNYVIADTDCDGKFDTKYRLVGEDITLPACLK